MTAGVLQHALQGATTVAKAEKDDAPCCPCCGAPAEPKDPTCRTVCAASIQGPATGAHAAARHWGLVECGGTARYQRGGDLHERRYTALRAMLRRTGFRCYRLRTLPQKPGANTHWWAAAGAVRVAVASHPGPVPDEATWAVLRERWLATMANDPGWERAVAAMDDATFAAMFRAEGVTYETAWVPFRLGDTWVAPVKSLWGL